MTVEFTVLVPVFVLLLVFFADATVIYMTHTQMFNAAREISRRVSTGELEDESAVQAYAAEKLMLSGRTYYVDSELSDDNKVIIGVYLYEAVIFGNFFEPILGDAIFAVATTGEEPRLE